MKKALTAFLISVLAFALSSPATAACISPPACKFMVTGGNLVRNGNNGWARTWTFNLQGGAGVGGSPARASGTMAGGTVAGVNCNIMTVDPSTFTISTSDASGGTDVFHGLNFKQSGSSFCSAYSAVPSVQSR